jgi:hypothetical protein
MCEVEVKIDNEAAIKANWRMTTSVRWSYDHVPAIVDAREGTWPSVLHQRTVDVLCSITRIKRASTTQIGSKSVFA